MRTAFPFEHRCSQSYKEFDLRFFRTVVSRRDLWSQARHFGASQMLGTGGGSLIAVGTSLTCELFGHEVVVERRTATRWQVRSAGHARHDCIQWLNV